MCSYRVVKVKSREVTGIQGSVGFTSTQCTCPVQYYSSNLGTQVLY